MLIRFFSSFLTGTFFVLALTVPGGLEMLQAQQPPRSPSPNAPAAGDAVLKPVTDWFERANREYQNSVVKELSVPTGKPASIAIKPSPTVDLTSPNINSTTGEPTLTERIQGWLGIETAKSPVKIPGVATRPGPDSDAKAVADEMVKRQVEARRQEQQKAADEDRLAIDARKAKDAIDQATQQRQKAAEAARQTEEDRRKSPAKPDEQRKTVTTTPPAEERPFAAVPAPPAKPADPKPSDPKPSDPKPSEFKSGDRKDQVEPKVALDKAAQEKAVQDRAAQDRATQDRATQDRAASEKLAAENERKARIAASEKASADRVAAEKDAVDKASADQERRARIVAAAEKARSERVTAEQAAADKVAAGKATAENLRKEKLASEKAAVDKSAADRKSAEKAERERKAWEAVAARAKTIEPPPVSASKGDKPGSVVDKLAGKAKQNEGPEKETIGRMAQSASKAGDRAMAQRSGSSSSKMTEVTRCPGMESRINSAFPFPM